MKTHQGNVGAVVADISKITIDTLEKFQIPYDELYFGKPYADFYVDDLAVNLFEPISKALGFYTTNIPERSFNRLEESSFKTIVKSSTHSTKIQGEIEWYQSIPLNLRSLFPVFIRQHDHQSYEIEKIEGIPLSYLYVNETLTQQHLVSVLRALDSIHSQGTTENDVNGNYLPKLYSRYNENRSFYLQFEGIEEQINQLKHFFENYVPLQKSQFIHGDSVLSNILITQDDSLKFIDMKGHQQERITTEGDSMYDYAKIYQSLIGYEHIQLSGIVNTTYTTPLITFFETYFVEKFGDAALCDLKMITRSLLLSLLPLHKNEPEKCKKYHALTFQI